MPETLQEKLKFLRDEFSDEIPEEIVHSDAPNNRFKVRKGGYFQTLVAVLENAVAEGEITDPVVVRKVTRGYKRFTSERFVDKPKTTKREILYTDLLINLVLGESQN